MAQIGQVIYNLQDYVNSGGYIATSNADVNKTISSVDGEEQYENNKIDIFDTNLVSRYSSGQFTKLGIQAPPGTRVILNTNKTILIGQSGIYELDDDIVITSLQFTRPRKYIKDQGRTETELNFGIEAMEEAIKARDAALAELEAKKDEMTTVEYWTEFTQIQSEYDTAYQAALEHFNNGLNGIYKLDEENPYQDLYNIIIDFTY